MRRLSFAHVIWVRSFQSILRSIHWMGLFKSIFNAWIVVIKQKYIVLHDDDEGQDEQLHHSILQSSVDSTLCMVWLSLKAITMNYIYRETTVVRINHNTYDHCYLLINEAKTIIPVGLFVVFYIFLSPSTSFCLINSIYVSPFLSVSVSFFLRYSRTNPICHTIFQSILCPILNDLNTYSHASYNNIMKALNI